MAAASKEAKASIKAPQSLAQNWEENSKSANEAAAVNLGLGSGNRIADSTGLCGVTRKENDNSLLSK